MTSISGGSSPAARSRRSRRGSASSPGRGAPRRPRAPSTRCRRSSGPRLRGELADPDPDLITELAERLAQVAEIMRSAALRGGDDPPSRSARDVPAQAVQATSRRRETAAAPPAEPPQAPRTRATTDALKDGQRRLAGWRTGRAGVRAALGPRARGGDRAQRRLAAVAGARRARGRRPGRAVEQRAGGDLRRVRRRRARRRAQAGHPRRRDRRARLDHRAQTGRAGAEALGTRISRAVRDSEPWRGAPMVATSGWRSWAMTAAPGRS